MQSSILKKIAIVGAGVAGVSLTLQLIKKLNNEQIRLQLFIFSRHDVGYSPPFSDTNNSFLLNTSLGINSIFPDDKKHFYHWVKKNHEKFKEAFQLEGEVNEKDFIPRYLYGIYLNEQFNNSINANDRVKITHVREEISSIQKANGKSILVTETNNSFHADIIVLCTGRIFDKKNIEYSYLNEQEKYLASPYETNEWHKRIFPTDNVLILGGRLSAIDALTNLYAQNHKGKITIASRSGIFPAVRTEFVYSKVVYDWMKHPPPFKTYFSSAFHYLRAYRPKNLHITLRNMDMLRLFDFEYNQAKAGHVDWQDMAVPVIILLNREWPNWTQREQFIYSEKYSRFLTRYISSFPLQTAGKMYRLLQSKQLHLEKGVMDVKPYKGFFRVHYSYRNLNFYKDYSAVINATNHGKISSVNTINLYKSIFKNEEIINYMGGINVDPDNFMLTSIKNQLSSDIYFIGANTAGIVPVTNVIFYIIEQAEKTCRLIINRIKDEG